MALYIGRSVGRNEILHVCLCVCVRLSDAKRYNFEENLNMSKISVHFAREGKSANRTVWSE